MVIFRGINLEYFDEGNITDNKKKKLISDWNLDLEKKTILLPGRLTSWKGQNILIEALNILIPSLFRDKVHFFGHWCKPFVGIVLP